MSADEQGVCLPAVLRKAMACSMLASDGFESCGPAECKASEAQGLQATCHQQDRSDQEEGNGKARHG